jgi:V8-like Glu-specific endopeptidase
VTTSLRPSVAVPTAISGALDLLDDLADRADYSVIGPRDSRVHETDTTRFPFNTICHLERDFGDGRWRGCSGVMVGPVTVLTAAHCLYSHLFRRAPVRIRVSPGRRDRDTTPYGTVDASRGYVPRAYLTLRRARGQSPRDHDYGVLRLRRAPAGIERFMTVRALSDDELDRIRRTKLVTIAGYPGDRPLGTMWRHTERLTGSTPRRLFYTVDTCPGHSGSPIWFKSRQAGERVIIGIHTSGVVDEVGRSFGCSSGTVLAPSRMRNSGVRVTAELLETSHLLDGSAPRLPAMVRVH